MTPTLDTSQWDSRHRSSDQIPEWLSRRYRHSDDKYVNTHVLPAPVFLAGDIGSEQLDAGTLLGGMFLLPASVRMVRAHGSTRNRIGLFHCDYAHITYRIMVPLWSVRVLVSALAAASTLLMGGSITASIVFGFAAWVLQGWRGRTAFPIYLAALVWAALTHPVLLWVQVPAFMIYRACRLMFASWMRSLMSPMVFNSPAAFLGTAAIVRAMWNPTLSSVLLAVDKATHDDRARTTFFVDAALLSAPPHLTPVLLQCRANAAAANLQYQQALQLAQQASVLAEASSTSIRGWCALQFGDLLLASGRSDLALQRWDLAAELLGRRRSTRYWRIEADLRRAEALTADLEQLPNCELGLRLITELRAAAITLANIPLLDHTEFLILRMMHAAGNRSAVLAYLDQWHEDTGAKVDAAASVSEYAHQNLLLAALLVDLAERPEHYDEAEITHKGDIYEYAASLCDTVLGYLNRTYDPLTQAQSFAILARIHVAQQLNSQALADALACLNAVQQVRYELPATHWRNQWTATHAETYALAVTLAAEHDPTLVAELLEVVRAQAVPLETNQEGALVRAIFDALVSATGLPESFGLAHASAGSVTDPVLTDRTILVQDASWVGGDRETAIDLDAELTAMYPSAWYWSYCRVGDTIFHAIRNPNGHWHTTSSPYQALIQPLQDVFWHLPVHFPGQRYPEHRLKNTALTTEFAHAQAEGSVAGKVFSRLFAALGDELIPSILSDHLTTGQGPHTLVVAPTGALSAIPVTALHIGLERPLIETSVVVHLPSVALLAHRRVANQNTDSVVLDNVLGVLVPHCPPGQDPGGENLPYAESTIPAHSTIIRGPVTKGAFSNELNRTAARFGTLLLTGHVSGGHSAEPATTGYNFSDGRLTLRDFYAVTPQGNPQYRMPPRVVLAACGSLGTNPDIPADLHRTDTIHAPEWLGIGAAVVHSGAEHVICTLYKLPDSETTRRIDLALIAALRKGGDPATILRAVQLDELDRWRHVGGALPLAFLAYTYVGLGRASQS
ncbi:CHAT domain-containing protein [Nocardia sp. NPDC058058]|uniref:CHAT domain-containing protein n=1 Tax=Nocardia sp. NPDC058058 TaxID=3346317 RepID=UPI0036DB44C1